MRRALSVLVIVAICALALTAGAQELPHAPSPAGPQTLPMLTAEGDAIDLLETRWARIVSEAGKVRSLPPGYTLEADRAHGVWIVRAPADPPAISGPASVAPAGSPSVSSAPPAPPSH